jgi:hypothetical protein
MHHHSLADHEWDDPACPAGHCDHSQLTQEIDPDSMQAAQSDGGYANPVSAGDSSMPVSPPANSDDPDERLC